jgi:Flp pilus assembly pilin Flp
VAELHVAGTGSLALEVGALYRTELRPLEASQTEWLAPTSRKDDPGRPHPRHAQATMLMARLQSDKGQTYVEYALILAAVVVATLLAVTATPLGTAIQNAVTQVSIAL